MDPRFSRITRDHIVKACEDILSGQFKAFTNSTKYSVAYDNRDLPPKAVISRAYSHATGLDLPVQGDEGFAGGRESNAFLTSLGFQIVERPSDETLKL